MIKTITQSDLICYFYGEVDAQTKDYIDNNIDSNPDWVTLLNDLREIKYSVQLEAPSNSNIQIILEESLLEENHSY